jgi:hypothetical protein
MLSPTRGIRSRNPGNVEYGAFARKYGATGSDGRFAIFPTMRDGIRALCELLIVYSVKPDGKGGLIDTVEEAINRWAPSNENHTAAYIALVCAVLGCNKDDEFDFTDPNFLFWMATGIGSEENGADVFAQYVTDADIDAGVAAALA